MGWDMQEGVDGGFARVEGVALEIKGHRDVTALLMIRPRSRREGCQYKEQSFGINIRSRIIDPHRRCI